VQSPAPLVTVVMATWNWSEVLPYSIGSVLLQTFGDFELLVVGDGCTDDSESVVKAIGDARVRWINLPNNSGHQSAANNEGLRQARGKLIAYLGHDDLWLPDHLSCLVQAINAGADIAHGIVRFVTTDEDDGCLVWPRYVPGDWLPPSSVVHRKDLVTRVGGWRDFRTLSDEPEVELWRRFYEAGAKFRFVPRLTIVKLPAARRKDVYQTRPCHEQAAWLDRIRSTDVEAEELASQFIAVRELVAAQRYSSLVRAVARRGAVNLLARLRAKARPHGPGESINNSRLYKGLGRVGEEAAVNSRPGSDGQGAVT
jgi:glycosyltransferase involved in cell wall biosynthesis